MTLAGVYFEQFTLLQYAEFCLRLIFAFLVGGMVGLERSQHFKEAGVRTHVIVCCTSALIMLISKYGFADMGSSAVMEAFGTKGADSARVAAQAVSGISFLCAGVIIKVGGNIRGLTTAAGIWMTASIGLAIGAGMYIVSAFMAILLFLMQYVFRRVPLGSESYDGYHLKFVVKTGENFQATLKDKLNEWKVTVVDSTITWKRNDVVEFDYVILCPEEIRYSEIRNFVKENDGVVSFSYAPQRRHFT
jgi:putative Mg2+ transporter-C (MgtC) family protein